MKRPSSGLIALALAAVFCAGFAATPAHASVTDSIQHLQKKHKISKRKARQALAAYDLARDVKKKLKGKKRAARRKALAWQIHNVERYARRGQLNADRVTPLFVTLKNNANWFKDNEPRAAGTDRRFGSSRIIFQYFAGTGWQFHPLSNFARLNAVWTINDKPSNRALRAFSRELVRWGVHRGKGLVWEYYFGFSGAKAPFISSISQGTAIQSLARVGYRMHNRSVTRAAVKGSLAFNTPASRGLRLRRDHGYHYLGYSTLPKKIILNMFLQSIDAIHDFALITNNRKGRWLYTQGVEAAKVEVPKFDTGSWSLYSLDGEKDDVHYHELTITFLDKLCKDTKEAVFCDTRDKFQSYLDKK
ncbi:MAG: D-glucuronyl C5-epimerase family protein [Solirubrobacterales bacterium]